MNRSSLLLAVGLITALTTACGKQSGNNTWDPAPAATSSETSNEQAVTATKLTSEELQAFADSDSASTQAVYKSQMLDASQISSTYLQTLAGLGDLSSHLAELDTCMTVNTIPIMNIVIGVDFACTNLTGSIGMKSGSIPAISVRVIDLSIKNEANSAIIKHEISNNTSTRVQTRTVDDLFKIAGNEVKIAGSVVTKVVGFEPAPTPPPFIFPPLIPPGPISTKTLALVEAPAENVISVDATFSIVKNGLTAEEVTVTSKDVVLGTCGLEKGTITYTSAGGVSVTKTLEACPVVEMPIFEI